MATPESGPNIKRLRLLWWRLDTCTTSPHTNLVTHDVQPGNQTKKGYLELRLSRFTICPSQFFLCAIARSAYTTK